MDRRALCLALLLLLAAPSVLAQQAGGGLLLGLRYPTTPDTSADQPTAYEYVTLLLTRSSPDVWNAVREPELAIPRADTLWRAGVRHSVYNDWRESFTWATPAGVPPVYSGIAPFNGEYCQGYRSEIVHFAAPAQLSLERVSTGYCEDAAHPWTYHTLAVVPLDSTSHLGLTADAVLGAPALRALADASARFLRALPDDEARLDYLPQPDPASWGFVREPGRWVLRGRLDPASATLFTHADFPFSAPRPASVPPPVDGEVMEVVRGAYPGARDVFSQSGSVVLLHADRLTVHALSDHALSEPRATFPVPPHAVAVMERWLPTARAQQIRRAFAGGMGGGS